MERCNRKSKTFALLVCVLVLTTTTLAAKKDKQVKLTEKQKKAH
jgi:hypothetical protein